MKKLFPHVFWMVVFSLCLFLFVVPGSTEDKDNKNDDEYYRLMQLFADSFERIDRHYVKEVDREKLIEAAIEGMVGTLDQYSTYISSKDLSHFNEVVDQEFGGIGIQISPDPETKKLTVITPLPGTPAYKAGIRAGDVIMEINNEKTDGFSIERAIKLLKGKPGEEVTIGVKHLDSDNIEQIKVTRAIIHVSTVLGDKYNKDSTWNYYIDPEDKIGYIRLTHFSRRSANELRSAMETLTQDGLKGLILDLRFNPGGLLSQATEISDMFIEEGKIVSTKGRNIRERTWNAKKEGTYSGFPLVILINRYSASASEIVSACLQDNKRAVVIGERSWGKGSVQNVIEVGNGGKSSALKLTTASYHRPSGKNIHRFPGAKETDEWGVFPDKDHEVKMDSNEMKEYLEYRKERDILQDSGPPKSEFVDKQLSAALDFLKNEISEKQNEEKPASTENKEEKAPAPASADNKAAWHPFEIPGHLISL